MQQILSQYFHFAWKLHLFEFKSEPVIKLSFNVKIIANGSAWYANELPCMGRNVGTLSKIYDKSDQHWQ